MKYVVTAICLLLPTQVHAAEMAVSLGTFHGGNHAPSDTASGDASIVKLEDGSFELRFAEDFSTTPGPDLVVYLSTADDPKSDASITGNDFVDAGKLASPTGAQKLALPRNFDPKKFKSVAIWCKSYSVLFGAAALK